MCVCVCVCGVCVCGWVCVGETVHNIVMLTTNNIVTPFLAANNILTQEFSLFKKLFYSKWPQ